MLHRGEIVERVVRESGIPLTKIAEKMKRSRRWLYDAFETPDLSLDTILNFGKILGHDFSAEIPQLSDSISMVNEPTVIYGENTVEYWKEKYYTLLEEHYQILKTINNTK